MRQLILGTARRVADHAPASLLSRAYLAANREKPGAWLDMPFFLLHVPKCAGTSICRALDMPDPGHALLDELPGHIRARLAQKPCLAILRDPLSRIVSTYYHAHDVSRLPLMNFASGFARFPDVNAFILDYLSPKTVTSHYFLRPSALYVESARRSGARVALARLEDADRAVVGFIRDHGIPLDALPHEGASSRPVKRASPVSEEARRHVEELYAEDVQLRLRAGREGRYAFLE